MNLSHDLRDQSEAVIRAWDAHEVTRGGEAIIDYDCYPTGQPVNPAPDRLWVLRRLTEIHRRAVEDDNAPVVARVRADLAYLRALLGERAPVARYIRDTQGCVPTGWDDEDLDRVRERARGALDRVGVAWGPGLEAELRELEGPLSAPEAAALIPAVATELEPAVRALTGTEAAYTLAVETTDQDAYWAYWLDGVGSSARLRINLRHARFTRVRVRQFALHEVLGHALQSASYTHHATMSQVPWVRLLSVHTPYQVLLEGLAQALPLFVAPDDHLLVARVRLAHYAQLVHARLHLAINAGESAEDCAALARSLVPYWSDADIADGLADRGTNPLLRSYLWSYPAGLDWFVALADHSPERAARVFQAAYREPLTPGELMHLSGDRLVPAASRWESQTQGRPTRDSSR